MAEFRFNVREQKRMGVSKPASKPSAGPPDEPSTSGSLAIALSARALVDSLPCPAMIINGHRQVEAVNTPLCETFGLERGFFRLGEEFADFACRTSLSGGPGLLALGDLLASNEKVAKSEIIANNGAALEARATSSTDGKTLITLAIPAAARNVNIDAIACNIVENTTGAVLSLVQRPDGRIQCRYANSLSPGLFGRGMAEITSPQSEFRDLIADEHRLEFDRAIVSGIQKSTPIDIEFQIKNAVTGLLWVRCIGAASPGEDGSVICDILMRNVEDRRQVTDERWRLQKLLDLIIDNIPFMVSVRDAEDMSMVFVNCAYVEMSGVSREKIIGSSDFRLFKERGTKDRNELLRPLIEHGRAVEYPEIEIKTRTKGVGIFKSRIYPLFDDDSNIRFVLTITEDVTKRRNTENALRHSEQRFLDSIESVTDGIALFDSDARLLLCNERYKTMWPGFDTIAKPGVSFETLVRHYNEQARDHGGNFDVELEVERALQDYRILPAPPPIRRRQQHSLCAHHYRRRHQTPQHGKRAQAQRTAFSGLDRKRDRRDSSVRFRCAAIAMQRALQNDVAGFRHDRQTRRFL